MRDVSDIGRLFLLSLWFAAFALGFLLLLAVYQRIRKRRKRAEE